MALSDVAQPTRACAPKPEAGLLGPAYSNHTLSSDFNLSRHVRTHPRSVARLHPLSLPNSNFFELSHRQGSRLSRLDLHQ